MVFAGFAAIGGSRERTTIKGDWPSKFGRSGRTRRERWEGSREAVVRLRLLLLIPKSKSRAIRGTNKRRLAMNTSIVTRYRQKLHVFRIVGEPYITEGQQ